jgi:sulfite exporter TauE/SafE
MLMMLAAIATASLLGSAHCVGMCGPMLLIATGLSASVETSWRRRLREASYHLGRAVTYAGLGLAVGLTGWFFQQATGAWSWVASATTLAGWAMIGLGGWQLWSRYRQAHVSRPHGPWMQWWIQRLAGVRRWSERIPEGWRPFLWGMVSTLLPCGWLYTFVLVAAGAGSIAGAVAMMMAFWVGTLPALVALNFSWTRLQPRLQSALPSLASLLLILFGGHVVWGRNYEALENWLQQPAVSRSGQASDGSLGAEAASLVHDLSRQVPPCCRP